MEGHKPRCIITDQDCAMRVAIPQIFDTTAHRFCMWHIMRKLPEKISPSLRTDGSFNWRFKSCVYDSETIEEFELAWNSVIAEFDLANNGWLTELYNIRSMWIPAFFKDLFLGSVMKTTSRSESENHFFSNFNSPHLSLVEFWMRFEGAIEVQRHRQSLADHQILISMPELKTDRGLERHAGMIYTYANFYKFQNELWRACMDYEVYDRKELEEGALITIANYGQNDDKKRQVMFNSTTYVAQCSCKMFEGEGIPCHHILCLLKGLNELPNHYIVDRWTKMAAKRPMYDFEQNILDGCAQVGHVEKIIQANWMSFLNCMQLAGKDLPSQAIVTKAIKEALRELRDTHENHGNTSGSKTHELESFIGSSAPKLVEVLPPKEVHGKGSGKRIKGGMEVAMERQKKQKRLCRICGKGNHNSRTCSKKPTS